MTKIFAATAALGMALAPVAASAGTRAADVVPATYTVDRASADAENTAELGGSSLVIAALAAIAVIVGIIIAVDDDDNVSDG